MTAMIAAGVSIALALAQAAPAAAKSDLPGIWSLGETPNCETGPAWVFLADGYYAEMTLPDKGPSALGLWRDEGDAIAYTHSHVPFADMLKANEMRRLTMVKRTADRLEMRNYRGVTRIFHRCPAGSLKAPKDQAAH